VSHPSEGRRSAITTSWLGWGTFRVDVAGGPKVVIDPCVTPLLSDPHAAFADVADADLFLITHGHHEHLKDVPSLARRLPHVPIVAPAQVREYLVGICGIDRERITLAEPDRALTWGEARIVPRAFPHLPKHDVAGKLAILRRDNPLGAPWIALRYGPRILRSWLAIRQQPEFGPFLAYDLRIGGQRLLFTCEAFTSLLAADIVAAWAEGPAIDLAVVGVESGQEEAAAALTRALEARRAVGCAVHAPFERFYGKPPVDGAAWAAAAGATAWIPGSAISTS